MDLQPGATLGAYEVTGPLGAGAMGVVYRAKDPRLGRSVAIKIVSERAQLLPHVLKRFEQEARAASAIAHPNIVTVHEIGEVDGTPFIVMELIEGKSLRELLSGGALPLKTLLSIAVQIADGLAAAHGRAIVHRDLKPENVMVTPGGLVKILDFGLARPTVLSGPPTESTIPSPLRMTEPGVIVGTASYMSPEQARGADVDFRTDQFSFGTVLYEMATGRVAFRKESTAETMTAILREEPLPVRDLAPASPAPLRWIIERCLSKEREGRYDSTQDLARELHSLKDHASEIGGLHVAPSQAMPLPAPRQIGRRIVWGAAAATALLLTGFIAYRTGQAGSGPQTPPFIKVAFRPGLVSGARFAPDGKTVVYSASKDGGPSRVYSVIPGSKESHDLGIEGTLNSISPSGDLLLVRAKIPSLGATGTLYRASLSGAAPRALAEDVLAAGWSPDGKEIAALRSRRRDQRTLWRIEYPLGTTLYESEKPLYGSPAVFPDGKRVPFIERTEGGFDILTVDPSGRRVKIASTETEASFLNFGSRRGRMWIIRFTSAEPQALEVTPRGRFRPWIRSSRMASIEDISPDGRLLVLDVNVGSQMLLLESGAAMARDISWLDSSRVADLSRDGKTILFNEVLEAQGASLAFSVYLRRSDGTPAVRLGDGYAYSISPDERWVLARMNIRSPGLVLYPTGPGEKQAVTAPGFEWLSGRFFPDGERILVVGNEPGKPPRHFVLPRNGATPLPVAPELASIRQALISPDGRSVVLRDGDGRWWSAPSSGGRAAPLDVPDLKPNEIVIRMREDGKAFFTKRQEEGSTNVEAVELGTGRRTPVVRLPFSSPYGAEAPLHLQITPDGRTIVASRDTSTSDLYLVEGVK